MRSKNRKPTETIEASIVGKNEKITTDGKTISARASISEARTLEEFTERVDRKHPYKKITTSSVIRAAIMILEEDMLEDKVLEIIKERM